MQRSDFQINRSLKRRLRMFMRESFYQLPPRLQYHVGSAKRTLLQQFDWSAPVKRLRLEEQHLINETIGGSRQLESRKRVAIFSINHWSSLEYGLAMALRLRGNDVQGILCDGLLPLCEMNLGPNLRPPCEACIMNLSRFEDAFGFEYDRLKKFVTREDLHNATKLVNETPDSDLAAFKVDQTPVGLFARREIQRYYRAFIFEPETDPVFRKWLISGVLITWLSQRWLDHVKPDIAGVCSGRTLPTACFYEVARQRGIDVVTWDGVATRPDGFMFAHNELATEIPLDRLWPDYKDVPLSEDELNELNEFMGLWSRSEVTPFPYNTNPIEDETLIKQQLGFREAAPIVVAFTNTSWDIAVIDRDVGFESMFDWLFALVEFAIQHPEIDFVVRAHPAEKKVPLELQSRTPVCAEIRKRYAIPDNLKLIEGDDPTSSYVLARLATVNMVYASRFGLELALRGIQPWLAGAVTYREKGFTLDIESKEHMVRLLSQQLRTQPLSTDQVELAQRFAYLWFYRYEVRLPLLHPPDKQFKLTSFKQLGPGGDPALDAICDSFVSGRPFIELNKKRSTAVTI